MYSLSDTKASTASIGAILIASLLFASLFVGFGAAASTASSTTTDSLSNSDVSPQLDDTQKWCLQFMSAGVNADLPGDIECSALSDISPHQKISIDYSAPTQGSYQYLVLSLRSNASRPAVANITITQDGTRIASYKDAPKHLTFVNENHYNFLTREYTSLNATNADGTYKIPITTRRTLMNQYSNQQIELIMSTNLTQRELLNLRLYEMKLNGGEIQTVTLQKKYTASDFGGSTEQFEYKVHLDVKSRGQQVAETQFSLTKTLQKSILDEEVYNPLEDGVYGTNTTENTGDRVTQIIQQGFDVVLNKTIVSDISRYSDGTKQISALQDPSVPPNANGENTAVGRAEDMARLQSNNSKAPAVIYGSNTEGMLHIGTAYYGVPQANNHYLVVTYGLQGETADTNAKIRLVDRQGNPIDRRGNPASGNPRPFIIGETMDDDLDLSDNEQYREAINKDTINAKTVKIKLTEEEVQYINDNYAAFVTYQTDGGKDTLLLYNAYIVSTDIQLNKSQSLDGNQTDNTSEYQENPATFNINYRVPYSLNARFNQVDVLPGETFKVPVTITNNGDTRVERTVGLHDEYKENNMNYSTIVAERTVMVPPQSQKTVFLQTSWEGYRHGNHTLRLYDTTNSSDWEKVSSNEGEQSYSIYVMQPPTFKVVGLSAPDSWLRYDHFQVLVAVQNVGDLDTSYLKQSQRPYIQGKFGPWQGKITEFVSGGNVRAGKPGGTINMYFSRNIDYTPDYPNPNQYYSNNTWRQNAPYHVNLSANYETSAEEVKHGPFNLTVEAVHPWAVIDGTNVITGTPHAEYVTYNQLEAPQVDSEDKVYQKSFSPSDSNPFVNYNKNNKPHQQDMFIYQNELRNCHLSGDHTEYQLDTSSAWNETQIVNNCNGMWQKEVRIYELGISTIRMHNKQSEMVERYWNSDYEYITPNPGLYYASPWPYTETDPSSYLNPDTSHNLADRTFPEDHYAIETWNPTEYGTDNRLSTSEINNYLKQYVNGEISRDQLRKVMLSDQAYANGKQAFTDRQLKRATSCDGSTTSQLRNQGTPPNCAGFGLEGDYMPATLIENVQPSVETTEGHKLWVDVHVVNDGGASAGYARIKVITNKTNAGINNTSVVGYATAKIEPKSDKIIRVPVILPNRPGVEGHHDLQVRVRTEPDYTSYRTGSWEWDKTSGRFGIDVYATTWEDFVFKNLSATATKYKTINQMCDGIGVGECVNQGEQTIFTKFRYKNHGGEAGYHTINATYGFWRTPTGDGTDWPTLHHKQATQYWDDRTVESDHWLSTAPNGDTWVTSGSSLQKSRTQFYGPNTNETWVLQNRVDEPGIYRVYVTQERVNNEDLNQTVDQYDNTTYSMWGYGAGYGSSSSVSKYKNESHWVQFQVYDIKKPVSRFYYEAENFPRTHSASSYDDSRNGNVVIWEGGTAHFDGRERLDWTLQEFENGIAQDMQVSSDNVGIDVYEWRFTGGDSRIYQQAHDNRAGNPTEGKTSRRFNQSGTFQVTLQVWDYPQYTSGGNTSNPNTNQTTQTVEVKADNTPPSVDVRFVDANQNYDVNNDVVWSGTPEDRWNEFTTVDFEVEVDDNAIGLECGGITDTGGSMDNCGWEKTDGVWDFHNDGSVVESATWDSRLRYTTRQNSEECVTFYAHDFDHNRNEDTKCVTVHEDLTKPNPDYDANKDWVWARNPSTGYSGGTVTFDASDSYDRGNPAVGLHGEPYDHSLAGGWTSDPTKSTTYPMGSHYRKEYEQVDVRDWYGNQKQAEASVVVYTDVTDPTMDSNFNSYDFTYSGSSESASRTEYITVCATGVDDNGYPNDGVGLYDSYACHTFTASFSFSGTLNPQAPTPNPNPTPACEETECDTDTTSDTDTYTDSDSESGSATVTIEDYHGNTYSTTVSYYASATYYGSKTETRTKTECETGGSCPPPPPPPPPDPIPIPIPIGPWGL